MSKKIRASIMGGTGYAAAELIKRLVNHPNVELVKVASIDHVGKNVGEVHRNFGNRLKYTLENLTPEQLVADKIDLIFLALPHKVSYQMAPRFIELGVKIIDFSGDYRIQDVAKYNKYYKTEHSNPENIKSFVYGLPELNRDKIKTATRVANPGCFPTGTALATLPLGKAGLLNGKVRVVAPTGSSGSGVAPSEGTHHPIRFRNMKSYKPLSHQHQPEMEQTLTAAGGTDISVDFIPMSAPFGRGILVNVIVDLPSHVTEEQMHKLYTDYYKNSPMVRVLPLGQYPEIVAIAETNYVDVGISLRDERSGTKSFAAISAIDNLVRGASGQAIQNMNLMFGLEETTGLNDFGIWP